MQSVKVYRMRNGSRSQVFDGKVAKTWWERMRGLLGSSALGEREALLIAPCSSVHTFGMGYDIDVAFLDKSGRVIKCREHLAPSGFAGAWRSRSVLETAGGALRKADIQSGDRIYWCERNDKNCD